MDLNERQQRRIAKLKEGRFLWPGQRRKVNSELLLLIGSELEHICAGMPLTHEHEVPREVS